MNEPPPKISSPTKPAIEQSGLYHYPQYLEALSPPESKTKLEKSIIIKIVLTAIIAITPIMAGAIVLYSKIQIHGYQIVHIQEDVDWIESHLTGNDYVSEAELYAHNDAILMQLRALIIDVELMKQKVAKIKPIVSN